MDETTDEIPTVTEEAPTKSTETDEETVVTSLEKPSKAKRKGYVYTEARRKAFEKAREARQAKVTNRRKEKAPDHPDPVPMAKPRKPRRKVVQAPPSESSSAEESSSESADSSSDSSEDVVVIRKQRARRTKPSTVRRKVVKPAKYVSRKAPRKKATRRVREADSESGSSGDDAPHTPAPRSIQMSDLMHFI